MVSTRPKMRSTPSRTSSASTCANRELYEVRHKFALRRQLGHSGAVIRLEADVKHSLAKPKTVDEALAELESRVGKEGRRKFEKFLREVAEDEDEDAIDVESK